MNLRCWKIQTSSSCQLCNCVRSTSAHILNGCPTALQQGRYTYRHDQVLLSLLLDILKYSSGAKVFADLDNCRACNTPLATIPPSILTTSYRPDIVIFNVERYEICLLELTCPFNSAEHLQAAREQKSSKIEYQLLISELDRLGYASQYFTIKIGCLGHYLSESIRALQAAIQQSTAVLSSCIAQQAISSSQRIFLARDCDNWNT